MIFRISPAMKERFAGPPDQNPVKQSPFEDWILFPAITPEGETLLLLNTKSYWLVPLHSKPLSSLDALNAEALQQIRKKLEAAGYGDLYSQWISPCAKNPRISHEIHPIVLDVVIPEMMEDLKNRMTEYDEGLDEAAIWINRRNRMCISWDSPDEQLRQYAFIYEGLKDGESRFARFVKLLDILDAEHFGDHRLTGMMKDYLGQIFPDDIRAFVYSDSVSDRVLGLFLLDFEADRERWLDEYELWILDLFPEAQTLRDTGDPELIEYASQLVWKHREHFFLTCGKEAAVLQYLERADSFPERFYTDNLILRVIKKGDPFEPWRSTRLNIEEWGFIAQMQK